jgi:hypothetical protein
MGEPENCPFDKGTPQGGPNDMDEKKIEVTISYDVKNDVLYHSFGKPREAYSVAREEGVFARLDPTNDSTVGIR